MLPALDVPVQVIAGQLLIGLINGSFYAMLSLGLAIIFGLLNIVNFMHGAQYMLVLSWHGCSFNTAVSAIGRLSCWHP